MSHAHNSKLWTNHQCQYRKWGCQPAQRNLLNHVFGFPKTEDFCETLCVRLNYRLFAWLAVRNLYDTSKSVQKTKSSLSSDLGTYSIIVKRHKVLLFLLRDFFLFRFFFNHCLKPPCGNCSLIRSNVIRKIHWWNLQTNRKNSGNLTQGNFSKVHPSILKKNMFIKLNSKIQKKTLKQC